MFFLFFIFIQFPVLKDSQNAHLQNVLARLDTFAKVQSTKQYSYYIIFFKYALVYFAHRTGAPEPILVCRENHKESLSSIFFKEVLSNVRIIK